MVAFRAFEGKQKIDGRSLEYRVSVQPRPEPAAVCLSTDLGPDTIVVIALEDWPEIITTVEILRIEEGL